MEIIKGENLEETLINACVALQDCFRQLSHRSVLFLSSGGTALRVLDDLDVNTCPAKLTVSVLYERFGVKEEDSNYWQLMQTDFYKQLTARGVGIIDPLSSEADTVEEAAGNFSAKLIAWRRDNPNGVVLITQGAAPDGHTAGIIPYPKDRDKFNRLFDSQDIWVRGYSAAKERDEFLERITVTFPFLREWVDDSMFIITGEEKKDTLEKMTSESGELNVTPARIVREMKNVRVYTDLGV